MSSEEPLLQEENGRLVVFPIRHDELWDAYKKSVAVFWTAEEIKLSDDLEDWNNKLTEDERYFIKNVCKWY